MKINLKTLFRRYLKALMITRKYQITNKSREKKNNATKKKTKWKSKRTNRLNLSHRKNYSLNNSLGKTPNKQYKAMRQCRHSLFNSSMLVTKISIKLSYPFPQIKASRKKLSNKSHKTLLLTRSKNKQFIHSRKDKIPIFLALTF